MVRSVRRSAARIRSASSSRSPSSVSRTGTPRRTASSAARTRCRAAARLWAGAALPPLLSSFSVAALDAARAAVPELPRALLIEGPVPADWRARRQGLGCIGLNIDTLHADEAVVRDILDQGATLAVWTVDDPARARTLFEWGCQAVFTDELDRVRADAPGTAR